MNNSFSNLQKKINESNIADLKQFKNFIDNDFFSFFPNKLDKFDQLIIIDHYLLNLLKKYEQKSYYIYAYQQYNKFLKKTNLSNKSKINIKKFNNKDIVFFSENLNSSLAHQYVFSSFIKQLNNTNIKNQKIYIFGNANLDSNISNFFNFKNLKKNIKFIPIYYHKRFNLIEGIKKLVNLCAEYNFPKFILYGPPSNIFLYNLFYPRKISYWSSKFFFKPLTNIKSVFINSAEKCNNKNFYSFNYLPELKTKKYHAFKQFNKNFLIFCRPEKILDRNMLNFLVQLKLKLPDLHIIWTSDNKDFSYFKLNNFFSKFNIRNTCVGWFYPSNLYNKIFFEYGSFFLDTPLTGITPLNAASIGMPVFFFKDSRNPLVQTVIEIFNNQNKFNKRYDIKKFIKLKQFYLNFYHSTDKFEQITFMVEFIHLICQDIDLYNFYSKIMIDSIKKINTDSNSSENINKILNLFKLNA